jgi:hypothetical protein
VWTLTDPLGSVVSTAVTMTAGVGSATALSVGGINFTLTDGTTDFGLGATFTITVPATKANLTAGWKGTGGNAIKIELIGPSYGVTFAVTAMAGGLVDPTVDFALSQIGNVWITMVLNGLPIANTVALDTYKTYGEGRWGQTVKKPLVVFTGNIHSTPALASAVSSTRKTDRINSTLVAPGSPSLPIVVAARQLARIASVANNNPPTDYCAQAAETIIPGDDSVQWDDIQRNQAIKAGCSTDRGSRRRGQHRRRRDVLRADRRRASGVPRRGGYRSAAEHYLQHGQHLLPQGVGCRAADSRLPTDRQPERAQAVAAKAAMASMVDKLGLAAVLSDPAASKKLITAVISSINPKRLDVDVPVWLSGNSKIKSTTLRFSFFFGTPAVIG